MHAVADLTASQAAWLTSRRLTGERGSWREYEALKQAFVNSFPDVTPAQYVAAMDRIAEMVGV